MVRSKAESSESRRRRYQITAARKIMPGKSCCGPGMKAPGWRETSGGRRRRAAAIKYVNATTDNKAPVISPFVWRERGIKRSTRSATRSKRARIIRLSHQATGAQVARSGRSGENWKKRTLEADNTAPERR